MRYNAHMHVERLPISKPAELADSFELARVIPFSKADWAYELLVPKGFVATEGLSLRETGPFEPLRAGGFSSPDNDVVIDVALYRPVLEVSLIDYLGALRQLYGLEIVRADALVLGGHAALDALLKVGTRLVRMMVVRQGGAIVRVGAAVGEANYEAWAKRFAIALSTFRFFYPSAEPFLEPFAFHSLSHFAGAGLWHPGSWQLSVDTAAPEREVTVLRLVEHHDVRACMGVVATARPGAAGGDLTTWLAEMPGVFPFLGLTGALLHSRYQGALPHSGTSGSELGGEFTGRAFGHDARGLVALLRRPQGWFAILTVYPEAPDDVLAALAAKRAHEVAVLSLNQPDLSALLPGGAKRKPGASAEAGGSAAREAEEDPRHPALGVLRSFLDALGLDEAAAAAEERAWLEATERRLRWEAGLS